ncbi:MAG: hypothetical protein Q8L68_03250 [Methylococcales bacterium]|nr:hypothetical protein [Methylococcales bacterium]
MKNGPKTRKLDLGIPDYTSCPSDANYQPIRDMSDSMRVMQERRRNASSFFGVHVELVQIMFCSAHSLTINELRRINPGIVMIDTPDENTYPMEYFIGVPKDIAEDVIQKLREKKEINSVNHEITPQGMEYYNRRMTHYTVVEHPVPTEETSTGCCCVS